MYKSKLIELYKSLDSQELEQARKWVNSPMHNRQQDVTKLFDYLFSQPSITQRTIKRKKVFAYIYPERAYDNLQLRHLIGLAAKILEDFVSFSIQNKNSFHQKKALIQYSKSKKIDKLTERYIKKVKSNQEKNPLKNRAYYYQQYELEQEIWDEEAVEEQATLQHIVEHHAIAFVIETLRLAALAYERAAINKAEIPLLAAILEDVEEGKYKAVPVVQLYYFRYMLLVEPQHDFYFEAFKNLLLADGSLLSAMEVKDFYAFAIHYCKQQIQEAEAAYLAHLMELYKQGLEENIWLEKGSLDARIYRAILNTALRLKEHVWAAEFVSKYTSFLAEHLRANYNRYARIQLMFSKGAYKSTLLLLQQADFEELDLKLAAQVLLLKIHFEQKDKKALYALIARFYTFLKDEGISKHQKAAYKNVITITQKLFQLPPNNRIAKEQLLKQIEETNPLAERSWLLGKLQ